MKMTHLEMPTPSSSSENAEPRTALSSRAASSLPKARSQCRSSPQATPCVSPKPSMRPYPPVSSGLSTSRFLTQAHIGLSVLRHYQDGSSRTAMLYFLPNSSLSWRKTAPSWPWTGTCSRKSARCSNARKTWGFLRYASQSTSQGCTCCMNAA